MSEWQPIETAPKDGTPILAHCQPRHLNNTTMNFHYCSVVWWRRDEYPDSQWPWRHELNDSAAEPTHWQPLPAPPEGT